MKKKTLHIVRLLIMLLWFVPMAQYIFNFAIEPKLYGAYEIVDKPNLDSLNWKKWYSGDFQKEFNTKLEKNVGFRNNLILLRNEIDFRLMRTLHAKGMCIMKDNMLFEEGYIPEYLGHYYIGDDILDQKINKIRLVSDTLNKLGKPIIIIIEPDKASFYPEKISARFDPDNKSQSNYDYLSTELSKGNINFLDLNHFFVCEKDHSTHPYFTRTGMHWNHYAMAVTTDTIIKYLSTLMKRSLPVMHIDTVHYSDTYLSPDNDIEETINLIFPLKKEAAPYPRIHIEYKGKYDPKLLVIGDSYAECLFDRGWGKYIFKYSSFLYYNRKVYPFHHYTEPPIRKEDKSLKQRIDENDAVLLMITGINMHECFWGFFEESCDIFYPGKATAEKEKIRNGILHDRDWFVSLYHSAQKNDTTLWSEIEKIVNYRYFSTQAEKISFEEKVEYYKGAIRNDPEWLESVKIKAKEQNISLDDMIEKDARWMAKNNQ